MKRDIDLCRQLLFDLEAHGPDCAVNVLRNGAATDTDDRVRYHMRLLIDAGMAKEIDRTTGGIASVRLTHSGVEMLELCRSDARWRDAKGVVLEQTGGMSLTVLRTLLTKWAVEAVSHGESRMPRRVDPPYNGHPYNGRPYYRRVDPRSRYETARYDMYRPEVYRDGVYRDGIYRDMRDHLYEKEEVRLVRSAPDYRERSEPVNNGRANGYEFDSIDAGDGVSLPVYLV